MDQVRDLGLRFTSSFDEIVGPFADQVRGLKNVLAAESGSVPTDLGTGSIVQGMQTLSNAFTRSLDGMVDAAAKSLQRSQTNLAATKGLTSGQRERLWASEQTEVYGKFQEQLAPFQTFERTGITGAIVKGASEVEQQKAVSSGMGPRDYEFFSNLNNALAAMSRAGLDTAKTNIPEYSRDQFSDPAELAIAKQADETLIALLRRLFGPLDVLASVLKPGAIASTAKDFTPEQAAVKAFLHGVPGGSELFGWVAGGGAERLSRVAGSRSPRGPGDALDPDGPASQKMRERRQAQAQADEARRRGPFQGGDSATAIWINRGFQDDLKAVSQLRVQLAQINGLEELHGQLIDKNKGRYAAFKKEAELIARAMGILKYGEIGEAEPVDKRFLKYSRLARRVLKDSADLSSDKLSDEDRTKVTARLGKIRGVLEKSGFDISDVQEMLKEQEPTLQERVKHDQQSAARALQNKMAEFKAMREMVNKGEMPGGGLIAIQKDEEKQLNQYVSRYGFAGLSDELRTRYFSESKLSEGDKKQVAITLQKQFDDIVASANNQSDPALKRHGELKATRLLRENLDILGDAEISKIGGSLWKQAPILEFNEAKIESFERLTRTVRGLTSEMGKANGQDFSIAEQMFRSVEQQKKRYQIDPDEYDKLQAVMPTPMRDGKPVFTDSAGKARPINIRSASDRGTVRYQSELEQANETVVEQFQYLEDMKQGSGRRRHYEVQQYHLLKEAVNQYGNSLKGVNDLLDKNKGKVSALFAYLETTFVEQIKFQLRWQAGMTAIFGTLNTIRNSVALVIQFEQALKNVEQLTGATAVDMYTLSNTIRDLGTSSKFGALELANAMTMLGQAGVAAESAGETLRAVTALATATMASLEKSADIMTSIMVSFNVEANNMSNVANVLAAAINKSKLHTDTLGVAFNHMGTMAAQAGLSLEETVAAAGAMSNAGVRISTVGTSMRSMLGMMLSPTERFKQALWDVGLTMADVDIRALGLSEVLRRLYSAGFNVRSAFDAMDKRMASGAAVLIRHRDVYEDVLTAVTGTNRAYDMATEQMKPLENQLKLLHNRFQDLILSVGGFVTGPLGLLVTTTNELGTAAGEIMDEMSPGLRVTLESAGTTALAVGQLVVAMSALKVLAGTAGIGGYFTQLSASLDTAGGAMGVLRTQAQSLYGWMKAHPFMLATIAAIGMISAVMKYREAVEEAHLKEMALAKERIAARQTEMDSLNKLTKAVEKVGNISELSGQDLKTLGNFLPDLAVGMDKLGNTAYNTSKGVKAVREELQVIADLRAREMRNSALTLVRLGYEDLDKAVNKFEAAGGTDRIKELQLAIQGNRDAVTNPVGGFESWSGQNSIIPDMIVAGKKRVEELSTLEKLQADMQGQLTTLSANAMLSDPTALANLVASLGDSTAGKLLKGMVERAAEQKADREGRKDPELRTAIDNYLANFDDASGEAIKKWLTSKGSWLDKIGMQGMAVNAFSVIPEAFQDAMSGVNVGQVEKTANEIREAYNELYQKVNELKQREDLDGNEVSTLFGIQRAESQALQKISGILMKAWTETAQLEDTEWKRRYSVLKTWAQKESDVYKEMAADESFTNDTRLDYTKRYLEKRAELLYGNVGEAARALAYAKAEHLKLEAAGNQDDKLTTDAIRKVNAATAALAAALGQTDELVQESRKMHEAIQASTIKRELDDLKILKDAAEATAAFEEKKRLAQLDREDAVGEHLQLELQRRRIVAENITLTKLRELNKKHQENVYAKEKELLSEGEDAETKHFDVLKDLRTQKKQLIEDEVQLVMRRYDAMQSRLTVVVNRQKELVGQLFTDWSAGVRAVVDGLTQGLEEPEAQLKALKEQRKYEEGYNSRGVGDPNRGIEWDRRITEAHAHAQTAEGDVQKNAESAIDATIYLAEKTVDALGKINTKYEDQIRSRSSDYHRVVTDSAHTVLSKIKEVPEGLADVFFTHMPAQRAAMLLFYSQVAEQNGQYEQAAALLTQAKDKLVELVSGKGFASTIGSDVADELRGTIGLIEGRLEGINKRQQKTLGGERDDITAELVGLEAKLNNMMTVVGPELALKIATAVKEHTYELKKWFIDPVTLLDQVYDALEGAKLGLGGGLVDLLTVNEHDLNRYLSSMFVDMSDFFKKNPIDVFLKANRMDTDDWTDDFTLTEDEGWQRKRKDVGKGKGPVQVQLSETDRSLLSDIYRASRWGLKEVNKQLGGN